MRCAVLGGEGFIGSHVCEQLLRDGHEAVVFDAAVRAEDSTHRRMDLLELRAEHVAGFDRIYHLAGCLGTAETFAAPEEAVRVNVLGTLRVLQAALLHRIPVTYVTLGNQWLNPYTISKNAAARFCLMYHEYEGLPVQVVVTYNVFGPRQKVQPVRKIVPEFLSRMIRGETVQVHGDGEQVVDLVYAPDLARELTRETDSGSLEIGTGIPVTVNEVVRLCARALGMNDFRVEHLPLRLGEPARSVSLCSHGFRHGAATPLLEALRVTALWYRDHLTGQPR